MNRPCVVRLVLAKAASVSPRSMDETPVHNARHATHNGIRPIAHATGMAVYTDTIDASQFDTKSL